MATTITATETALDAVVIGESTIADDLEAGELTAVKLLYRNAIVTMLNELVDDGSLSVKGSLRAKRELELRDDISDRLK